MSFLENMNNNPEFLNDFLKYSAYITFKSNLTVDEMYLDIRTFFRYLIFSKNENNVEFDINTFKTIDISEITLNDMKNVSSNVIDNYLYFVKNSLDNSAKTRNRKLASLKKLFMYLDNQNLISINPVRNASCAKVEKRHPKYLNLSQSKKLLADSIQAEKKNKIRDYAITCIFLNCCIRANELVLIDLTDVKMDERTIRIHGKGNIDRIIYMDDAVIEAISEYLKVRPNLNKVYPDRNALFLSNRKQRISKRNVQEIIKNELKLSFTDTADKYHTHTLRHTGATLMYDENLQFVDLRLQNGQVELILRAMELYGYNLKFMVNDTDITTEERSRKQAKLEYTYQQILAIQAEQVNNKADLHDTNTKMAENMLESANILDFDKMIKKA